MQAEVLSTLEPTRIREVMPTFLAGFLRPGDAAERNRARVTELVANWSDDTLEQVRHHLANLGTEHRVYLADPACRILSRFWNQDVVTRSKLDGADHLRAALQAGPTLVLCNHLSYFDSSAADYVLAAHGHPDLADRLISAAGPKVYADLFRSVAAAGLNTLPVPQSTSLGYTAKLSARDLARRALGSLHAAQDALQEGYALQIYPEGSRTRTGRLRPFLRGVHRYLIAVEELQVVPAAIVGTCEIFPVDATQLSPGPVRLSYGAPFSVSDHDDARAALRHAHASVAALLPPDRKPDPADPPIR
ncbi:MAG: 1-acyl-sn-glycerol-3-phosphate acyltransferase [Deltaproteobacteria bacterium]|nr:1-acyl-sn-glycerol-3-phosphate acyltransferase [Deltaproteobacteria bacterium]MBW2253627.1 1-acyl-sn-glycerol-3-phosphate acyltransferase [Deltaproteobacteria bacterium]